MMGRLYLLLLTTLCLPLLAQGAGTAPAFTLKNTAVHTLTDDNGNQYRVSIAWPEAAPPENGFPIYYLLDGNDNFATVTDHARRLARYHAVTPGIVVGIDYPETDSRRSLDYTPASPLSSLPNGMAVGGAEPFRAFLKHQLLPTVEAKFHVDTSRRALYGHSFGGLFVLDTLFTEPSLFNTYVAASPSIWFANHIRLTKLAPFASALSHTASNQAVPTLLLTVGEHEGMPPPWANYHRTSPEHQASHESPLVTDSRQLAERLQRIPALRLIHRILADETHGTSPLPTLADSLPYAFADPSLERRP